MKCLIDELRRTAMATAGWTRQRSLGAAALALALFGWPAHVLAQPPLPAPAPTASRNWYFEALIVVMMMGLALFVVCRSSRRN